MRPLTHSHPIDNLSRVLIDPLASEIQPVRNVMYARPSLLIPPPTYTVATTEYGCSPRHAGVNPTAIYESIPRESTPYEEVPGVHTGARIDSNRLSGFPDIGPTIVDRRDGVPIMPNRNAYSNLTRNSAPSRFQLLRLILLYAHQSSMVRNGTHSSLNLKTVLVQITGMKIKNCRIFYLAFRVMPHMRVN